MCATPRPKCRAVLDALAADVLMLVAAAAAPAPIVAVPAPKVNKLARKKQPPQGAVAPANVPPPAPAVVDAASAPVVQAKADGPFHSTGVVVEIVGMEMNDQGRTCKEHLNCGEVMVNNVVVRLQKVQILVEGQEETAIATIWINNGINRCRIGFLPCHMVAHAARYDGAVAQVTCVFSNDPTFCDSVEHRMFHKNKGCCLAAIFPWPSPRGDTASN
jgi:hypothetical protein